MQILRNPISTSNVRE